MDSRQSHLDTKLPKKATAAKPLSVLPTKVIPLGVPQEEALLKRREVGG
jgi:hypothetical protein